MIYLLHGIENSGFPRVVADTCVVLPIAPIAAKVVITEHALVPFCADAPVNAEVFGQERCDILAQSIAGVSGKKQLSHTGVDESRACRSLQESTDLVLDFFIPSGMLPRKRGIDFKASELEKARTKFAGCKTKVVTPKEFEPDSRGAAVLPLTITLHALSQV